MVPYAAGDIHLLYAVCVKKVTFLANLIAFNVEKKHNNTTALF